ncbi:MAG TPA: PQQ-binding-like beta-propeller repeat protein, partial [Ktedonobacteraceae bacterium]
MQPLDDFLPAEVDAQNEEIIAFLRQSHDKVDIIAVDPEPQYRTLALASVRQRLREAQQAQFVAEPVQAAATYGLEPAQMPALSSKSEIKVAGKHRWGRGMSLIAATLCMALLVGSLLTVFGLLKRNASTQVSTAAGESALYVMTTGWLQKIDTTTGAQLWRVQLPYQKGSYDIPMNFPLVGNGVVYVTADSNLFAFNTTDGRELWSVKLNDGSADAGGEFIQPVLAHGRLYYGLQEYEKNSNRAWMILEAFDASSGHMLWQYNPTKMIDGLVVGNDTAYVTFNGMYGNTSQSNLVALNTTNGSVKWSIKTNGGHVQAVGILNADSDLVLNDGVIYQFLSSAKDGNYIYAYQADNGAALWHSQ